MRNKDNKAYFLKQINNFLDNDEVIKQNYKIEFEMIRDYLNSNNNEYLLGACNNIRNIFKEKTYALESYSILQEKLLSEDYSQSSYNKIKSLSRTLIIELLLKGFDLKSVKKMPVKIFSDYEKFEHNGNSFVRTEFPHNLKLNDFNNEQDFYQAVIDIMENISIKERLDTFNQYIESEPYKQFVIFPIEGIIAYSGFSIGEVYFYSPRMEQFVANPKDFRDMKLFHKEEDHIFNACVWVNAVDTKTAGHMAVEKIEKAFNVIRCFYKNKLNFKIIKSSILILNEDYALLSSGTFDSVIHERHKDQYSLNIAEIDMNEEIYLIFNQLGKFMYLDHSEQSFTEKKIIYSLHWFRKAEESVSSEDKLLNYWISIENLMDFKEKDTDVSIFLDKGKETTYSLAKELISCNEIIRYKNDIARELFRYICDRQVE